MSESSKRQRPAAGESFEETSVVRAVTVLPFTDWPFWTRRLRTPEVEAKRAVEFLPVMPVPARLAVKKVVDPLPSKLRKDLIEAPPATESGVLTCAAIMPSTPELSRLVNREVAVAAV
jgi:hypothetical protein